jgi:hypothetical protein
MSLRTHREGLLSRPEALQAGTLGIACILQDRPSDTRSLLVSINISQAPAEHQAIRLRLPEVEIDDELKQARRLVTAANGLHPADPMVRAARRVVAEIDRSR